MKSYVNIFSFGACSKQVSYLSKLWSIKTSCQCNIYRFQIAACLSSFALIKAVFSLPINDTCEDFFLMCYNFREVILILNISKRFLLIQKYYFVSKIFSFDRNIHSIMMIRSIHIIHVITSNTFSKKMMRVF